jgi:hypothetical protein
MDSWARVKKEVQKSAAQRHAKRWPKRQTHGPHWQAQRQSPIAESEVGWLFNQ